MAAMETVLARKMWATLEPTAAMIFFAREAFVGWERLEFPHRGMGYFAYLADPATVLAAWFDAADAALRRYLGGDVDGDEMRWAADTVARAVAACPVHGRPLFAAHAALEPPEAPHLRLWHGLVILCEYRGGGHVAALLAADVSGIDALVTYAATARSPFDGEFYRRSRAGPVTSGQRRAIGSAHAAGSTRRRR